MVYSLAVSLVWRSLGAHQSHIVKDESSCDRLRLYKLGLAHLVTVTCTGDLQVTFTASGCDGCHLDLTLTLLSAST